MRSPLIAALSLALACSSGGPRGTSTQAEATAPRRAAVDAGALSPAAAEPLSCEPYALCGCEMGCVKVSRVNGSTERYEVAEGEQAGQVFVRESPGWPLHPERGEACDESCRPGPATKRCRMDGGACAAETP